MADRYWVGGNGTWDTVSGFHWSNVAGGNSGFSVPGPSDNVFINQIGATVNLIYSPNVASMSFGTWANVNLNNNSITSPRFEMRIAYGNIDFGPTGKLVVQPYECNSNSIVSCFDTNMSTSSTVALFKGSRLLVVDTSLLSNSNCTIQAAGGVINPTLTDPPYDSKLLVMSVIGNNYQTVQMNGAYSECFVDDSFPGNLEPYCSVSKTFVTGNSCQSVRSGSLIFVPGAGNTATLITREKPWAADIGIGSKIVGNSVGRLLLTDNINPNISLMPNSFGPSRLNFSIGIFDFNGKNVNIEGMYVSNIYPTELARNGGTLTLVNKRPSGNHPSFSFARPSLFTLDSNEDPIYVLLIGRYSGLTLDMYGNASMENNFPSFHLLASGGEDGAFAGLDTVFLGTTTSLTNLTMDEGYNGTTDFAKGVSVFGNVIYNNNAVWYGATGTQPKLSFCSTEAKPQYFDFKDRGLYMDLEANVKYGALSIIGGFNNAKSITHTSGEFYFDPNYSIISGANYYAPPGNTFRIFDLGRADIRLSGVGNVWTSYGCDNYLMNGPESTLLLSNNSLNRYVTLSENLSFGNVMIGGNANPSISTLTIFNGNVTFGGVFGANVTGNHTIQFTSGTTTTLNGWNVVGNSTTRLGISSNGISQHYLNIQSGSINANSLRISLSNASSNVPGLVWFAGNNSIDGGQNDGWVFANISPPPPHTGNAFFIMNNP